MSACSDKDLERRILNVQAELCQRTYGAKTTLIPKLGVWTESLAKTQYVRSAARAFLSRLSPRCSARPFAARSIYGYPGLLAIDRGFPLTFQRFFSILKATLGTK